MFLINHIACIWRRLISANVFHSPWCQELVVSLSSSASPLNMTLNFPAVYYWFMVWSNRPSTSETFIAFVHSVPPVSVMYVCHRHRPFSDDDVSWQSVVVRLWLQSLSINSLYVKRGREIKVQIWGVFPVLRSVDLWVRNAWKPRYFCCALRVSPLPPARLTHFLTQKYTLLSIWCFPPFFSRLSSRSLLIFILSQ